MGFTGWAGRWPMRMADLGMTLAIWGIGSAAGVWLVCMGITRFAVGEGQLAGRRTVSEVLLLAPAAVLAAGLVVLAASGPAGWARRAAWGAAGFLVAATGILAMRKIAPNMRVPARSWLELGDLETGARWAVLGLGPVVGGLLLAHTARVAGTVGLGRLGWWCSKGALWLAFAVAAILAVMFVYERVAAETVRAQQAVTPPRVTQSMPGVAGPDGQRGPPRTFTIPGPRPAPPWHWSTGVQIGWVLVNTGLAAAVGLVWGVLVVVRLRLREVLGMRGPGANPQAVGVSSPC